MMPIPSNWLEELVAEWLSLEGFAVETLLPIQISGGRGGRLAPDVLGARIHGDSGHLIIRHCEVASWPASSAQEIAESYQKKFRLAVIQKVEQHFRRLFGVAQGVMDYEQLLVFGGITDKAKIALQTSLPNADIYTTDEVIRDQILPTIQIWRGTQQTIIAPATLPADKWLLQLLDYLNGQGMLRIQRTT